MQVIEKIVKLAKYYSVNQETFATDPTPTLETVKAAKLLSKNPKCFKSIDRDTLVCTGSNDQKYKINTEKRICSCRSYLKWKTCAHLIGYDMIVYNDSNNFATKPKRGRKKDERKKNSRRVKSKLQKCLQKE
jgi:hypothetical protein